MTILVAEDEESFIEALNRCLTREGFTVRVARDGQEALELFEKLHPDLILLDLMLPKMSGIDVCRAIRTTSQVPIIMVTAKSAEIDTVVGLEVGADDYVTKPYSMRELVARIRAVMRRRQGEEVQASTKEKIIKQGEVFLDPERHEVSVRNKLVKLPLKEFELLELLMNNAGNVLTRDVIIDRIWGAYYSGDTKTLDVHVKRLRSKIETDPSDPKLITTIRGLGYRFEDQKY
ncbi:MAG: response regulator transcription factor [Acidimicrobiaceae bacterium]|nr:response regulator transcription factor [Acidimicrobiaceae bacterium]